MTPVTAAVVTLTNVFHCVEGQSQCAIDAQLFRGTVRRGRVIGELESIAKFGAVHAQVTASVEQIAALDFVRN